MKKTIKLTILLLLITILGMACLTLNFIHNLSFIMRVDCATGGGPYKFIHPACQTYIVLIDFKNGKEARKKATKNLSYLIAAYSDSKGTQEDNRALALVRKFIAKGADINFADSDGVTPLHAAVLHNEPVLVELLLHHGADPNNQTYLVGKNDKALSPVELAIMIDKKGNREESENWKKILTLLESSNRTRLLLDSMSSHSGAFP